MFHLKRYRRLIFLFGLISLVYYQLNGIGEFSSGGKFKKGQLIHQGYPRSDNIQFDPSVIKYIPHESIIQTYKSRNIEVPEGIDWSKLAYVFYATSPERLLSVLVNIHQLVHYGSSAQFELIYTSDHPLCGYSNREKAWETHEEAELPDDNPILNILQKKYNVNIRYLPPLTNLKCKPGQYWAESFSKFHLWRFVNYDRVIYLDSDGFILKNMDQLFFIPPSLIATPIEYTLNPKKSKGSQKSLSDIPPTPLEHTLLLKDIYQSFIADELQFDDDFYYKLYNELPDINTSIDIGEGFDPNWKMRINSYVMVCQPNLKAWEWIKKSVNNLSSESWDMELVNEVWDLDGLIKTKGNSFKSDSGEIIPAIQIIPHSPYAILSGEFRNTLHDHANYITPPIYTGLLGDSQFEKVSLRELEKKLGFEVDNIEDKWGEFNEIGLWDWAWRLSGGGNAKPIVGKRSRGFDEEEDNDMFYAGMGTERYGWDPKSISDEIYYIHWSDYPLLKPWDIIDREILKGIDWGSLNKWSNSIDPVAELPGLKIMDDIVTNSYTKCISSRGGIDDKFGQSVCFQSIIEWKKLYYRYWKVMSVLRY